MRLSNREMEEEARQILPQHLLRELCVKGIGTRISQRFADLGGVELPMIERSYPRGTELLNLESNE